MPNPQSTSNGTSGPQGLREIAEAAYDDVIEQAEVEDVGGADETQESIDSGPQRDERGRFVAKSQPSGEAAAETPPSPEEDTQETEEEHPAPDEDQGQAAQPPSNWSAEDRANFEKLPPESKEFLLRRHSEMESDYQKRVQANAVSNQFAAAVAPVFQDPDIANSMQGRSPIEAIYQWGAFQKRAVNQDPAVRIQLLFELADRMQLDPAAVFGRPPAEQSMTFTPEELANPAIKKFADHIGRLNLRLEANQVALTRFQEQQLQTMTDARRAEIDAFADAKDANGNKLRPYFDAVLPIVMDLYRQNPNQSIEDCYNAAIAPLFGPMQAQAQASVQQRQNLARAQSAVRSNVRGTTAPVNKPTPPPGPRGLRNTIAEAAEEIGFAG